MKKKAISEIVERYGKQIIAVILLVASLLIYHITRKRAKKVTTYGIKGDGELSEARAQLLAEKLFDAMKTYGTDEKSVSEVLDELSKYKTAILQVHEAFGLNRYALGCSDVLGVKLNLRQWLQKELSRKEFAEWEYLYNNAVNG